MFPPLRKGSSSYIYPLTEFGPSLTISFVLSSKDLGVLEPLTVNKVPDAESNQLENEENEALF